MSAIIDCTYCGHAHRGEFICAARVRYFNASMNALQDDPLPSYTDDFGPDECNPNEGDKG